MEILKQRLGSFPLWVWLIGVTALGLGYYLYERHKAGSSSSTDQVSGQNTGNLVPESSIPQFVIQNQFPVSVSTPSSGSPAPAPTTGDVNPGGAMKKAPATTGSTAGYSEVNEKEATSDKKAGAKVQVLGVNGLLGDWKGPGSAPGRSLWVPTSWVSKHNGGTGKSGPGSPTSVTAPRHKAPAKHSKSARKGSRPAGPRKAPAKR